MKWLIGCLLALTMITTVMAGEDPYVAVVGNDINANTFYLSPKYVQFGYDQELFAVPVCFGTFPTPYRNYGIGCEQFRSQTPAIQPEICDTAGVVNGVGDFSFYGEPNARVTAGNSGWFEWYVRLPKKPNGVINLCIQCGILKPNAFAIYGFHAVELCAAETGERVAENCSREEVEPGTNPVNEAALPTIFATAHPGPYSNIDIGSSTFLYAFRNPGSYTLPTGLDPDPNSTPSFQTLAGISGTRILLKSCMDTCITVKLPVEGQVIGINIPEHDLEAGDIIKVRMNIPRANTVDIYCHPQSLKVMGIGESPF